MFNIYIYIYNPFLIYNIFSIYNTFLIYNTHLNIYYIFIHSTSSSRAESCSTNLTNGHKRQTSFLSLLTHPHKYLGGA